MNQSLTFTLALALLLTLAGLTLLAGTLTAPALAAPPPPTPAPDKAGPGDTVEYLITLPVPPAEALDVPADLAPEQAAAYARGLTYRLAQPVLSALRRLRAQGHIVDFQVWPDLHAVAVQVLPTAEALAALERLPGKEAVAPAEVLSTCGAETAKALTEQVQGVSQAAHQAARPASGDAAQATNPSIHVYATPGATWTYVNGATSPNIPVNLRILRGGAVIATQSTTSSSSGYYYFYPSYRGCGYYNWMLRPGDVVEVTAGGNTVSTVVAYLSAWADPATDTVAGRTDAGRSVNTQVYAYGSDACATTWYSQTVGTDDGGNFSAAFGGLVNFDRRAWGAAFVRDANGNSTYASFYAYRVYARFNSSNFYGYLKPQVGFIATLSRGVRADDQTSGIVSTYSGQTSASGAYSGWFTDTIQAGDVLQVSGGGVTMQYTAVGLDVTLNPATDQATGTTGVSRLVKAYFYKSSWGYIATSCSWSSVCTYTTASGAGAFTLNAGLDLVRGDEVDLYVYDAEGNYQYGYRYVPALAANLTWNEAVGYWRDPGVDHLTAILRDNGGTVKAIATWVWISTWDGSFNAWFGAAINPTDIIEVGDGAVTETMTVRSLTARLDGGSGHLAGSADAGHLVATLYDFRRDSEWGYGYCAETDVAASAEDLPGGAYDLTFSGAQVGGQDYATVWLAGPDGHYTSRYAHAFTVNAQKGSNYVNGYSETPGVPVTVTLQRSGSPVAVYTGTSQASGYYYTFLGGGATITQGDTLLVQTGDGDSVALPIPELTANVDGAHNRVYGRSPASEPVRAEARRRYKWGEYSWRQYTQANAAGDYSADFGGYYWSQDCSLVNLAHPCSQAAAYYYNTAGHQIWLEGPMPPSVGPDLYESDNVSATAKAYVGIQAHSFHVVTDTDWVTFTVPAADVTNAVPYRLETNRLGWGMGTRMRLYGTDGATLLNEWTGYENRGLGVSVLWTPPAAGTYYLEIRPPSSSYAAYCDAIYSLLILPVRARIYLPLVMRDYY